MDAAAAPAFLPGHKGHGKGQAPPVPHDVAKGKGKAKGAGKAPPPLTQPKGLGKGTHKGKSYQSSIIRPPLHLVAPPHVQPMSAHHKLNIKSAPGSLWDGLGLWEPLTSIGAVDTERAGALPLEGLVINYDRLRRFWALPDEAGGDGGEAAVENRHRGVLDHRSTQAAELAIRTLGLNADVVRQALTQGADLSPDQAVMLEKLAEIAVEHQGLLEAHWQRVGEGLTAAEALYLAIVDVDAGAQRAQLLLAQHALPEDQEYIQDRVQRCETIVSDLAASRPLSSVLQTMLIITNILSQQGNPGLKSTYFPAMAFQKVGQDLREPTSVLELVTEMLEDTDKRRSSLRFWRIFAVGRCEVMQSQKSLIWEYLDDLQASPWDVLALLQRCNSELFGAQQVSEFANIGLRMRSLARQTLPRVEDSLSRSGAVPEAWRRRIEELKRSVVAVGEMSDQAQHRAMAAAAQLNRLFAVGGGLNWHQNLGEAEQQLIRLRALGKSLREARSRHLWNLRQAQVRAPLTGGRRARHWTPVDTTQVSIQFTRDMDLIRQLTSGLVASSLPGGPEGSYGRDAETGRWLLHGARSHAAAGLAGDLLHGGPEVSYARDPSTGRWITAAASPEPSAPFAPLVMGSGAERGPEGAFARDPSTGKWVSRKQLSEAQAREWTIVG